MGLRGLWVCGSVGLGVCGSVALGVSKVRGSAGMGAWQVWGSGGLVERPRGRKREDRERKRKALGAFWELFRTILGEKNGNGEHRLQKSVQEIL